MTQRSARQAAHIAANLERKLQRYADRLKLQGVEISAYHDAGNYSIVTIVEDMQSNEERSSYTGDGRSAVVLYQDGRELVDAILTARIDAALNRHPAGKQQTNTEQEQ